MEPYWLCSWPWTPLCRQERPQMRLRHITIDSATVWSKQLRLLVPKVSSRIRVFHVGAAMASESGQSLPSVPFSGIESTAPSASLSVGHHQNLRPPPCPWSEQSPQKSLHLAQSQLACTARLVSMPAYTDVKNNFARESGRTRETKVSLSSQIIVIFLPK